MCGLMPGRWYRLQILHYNIHKMFRGHSMRETDLLPSVQDFSNSNYVTKAVGP